MLKYLSEIFKCKVQQCDGLSRSNLTNAHSRILTRDQIGRLMDALNNRNFADGIRLFAGHTCSGFVLRGLFLRGIVCSGFVFSAVAVNANTESTHTPATSGICQEIVTAENLNLPAPAATVVKVESNEQRVQRYFSKLEVLLANPEGAQNAVESRLRHYLYLDFNRDLMKFISEEFRIVSKDLDRKANEELSAAALRYAETIKDLNARIAKYNQKGNRPGFFELQAFGFKFGSKKDSEREQILMLENKANTLLENADNLHNQMHLRIQKHQESMAKILEWTKKLDTEFEFLETFENAISDKIIEVHNTIQKMKQNSSQENPEHEKAGIRSMSWRLDQLRTLFTTAKDTSIECIENIQRLNTALISYRALNDANTLAERSFEETRKQTRLQLTSANEQVKLLADAQKDQPAEVATPLVRIDPYTVKKPRMENLPAGVSVVSERYFEQIPEKGETLLGLYQDSSEIWKLEWAKFAGLAETETEVKRFLVLVQGNATPMTYSPLSLAIVRTSFVYRGYRVGDTFVSADHSKTITIQGFYPGTSEVIVTRQSTKSAPWWRKMQTEEFDQGIASGEFTFEPNMHPYVE